MWVNRNAGNPNAWTVDFDKSQQAFSETLDRIVTGRVTWQATPRNKLNFSWQEQIYQRNFKGGGAATTTIEATNRDWFEPSRLQGVTWSSPLTSRILLEAGWGTYESRYRNPAPRIDGTHNDRMIRAQDQGGEIPNLIYRMPAGVGGGFNHHLIGTKANNRASMSFVTGAHNMKFGYQGGFSNPSQTYQYFNEVNFVRLRDGVPNQLRQVITTDDSPARIKVVRNLWPTSFYAQDQWTNNRLTLQGGIRYDWYLANYPESRLGGPGYTASIPNEIVYPSRSTQGISWHDVTPRMGVAYDLFGNGKTAVKFNLGKYMQANSAANNDLDLNPIIRTAISTTRVWTDTNRDFVAELRADESGEERGMRGDGQQEPRQRGVRPHLRPLLHGGLGLADVQLGAGRVGPAGSGAARLGERGLLPQLVGELVHRRQPREHVCRTGRRSASRRRSIRGCRAVAARRWAPVQPRFRARSAPSTSWRPIPATSRSRARTGMASMSASARGCGTGSRSRAARAPGAGSRMRAR